VGRILLITGTDTGVGKTYVAQGVVRALRALDLAVAVRKPVETGCVLRGGEPFASDAEALREAAASEETIAAVCPFRLLEPLAPAIAAARAGVTIDVSRLVEACVERAARVDWLVVEGAGGLLVPLAGRYSYADLARDLAAEVLLVVGARLGAINHALLSLEAARSRDLQVLGYVVNHFTANRDLATDTLLSTLRGLTDTACLGEVGFAARPEAVLQSTFAGLHGC
jgi:dethiobiotin synthetase